MIFVVNNDLTSSFLRGHHIAKAMGAKLLFADIECARNQSVVFVKDADRGLVLDAKDRGNRVIYDVIDYYCYRGKRCLFGDLVDVLIVPNKACIEFYKPDFPVATFAVIPHQWDYRIKGQAPQDTFRPAYIGNNFNKPQFWTGPEITNPAEFLQAAPLFNLHLALQKRDEKAGLLKPSTKISTAAAVGANVVTYDDPGAVELLGADYPYIVRDDPAETIAYAQQTFGGPIWKRALDRMKEAKERTSMSAVVGLYRKLDVNELREAA
jgi:hypothetical protein